VVLLWQQLMSAQPAQLLSAHPGPLLSAPPGQQPQLCYFFQWAGKPKRWIFAEKKEKMYDEKFFI
jgi:hypothetical protein